VCVLFSLAEYLNTTDSEDESSCLASNLGRMVEASLPPRETSDKHRYRSDLNPQPGGLQHNPITAALSEQLAGGKLIVKRSNTKSLNMVTIFTSRPFSSCCVI